MSYVIKTNRDKTKSLIPANQYWEDLYQESYDGNKYKKESKNFSREIVGKPVENPHIYIIPRQRGGPSYKDVNLEYDLAENIQFCPVSKGYSMQDVSSFTLGPVIKHGLNVVNSAFSKTIAVMHIDGSGEFDQQKKMFWKKNRAGPVRDVRVISDTEMKVDGVKVVITEWLNENKHIWFDNWRAWHNAIRMSPDGNFNWTGDSYTLCYCNIIDFECKYMGFVEWKKTCYIGPAYNLFEKNNKVINFLKDLYCTRKISVGLVHPMGKLGDKERAITPSFIRSLYDSPYEMTCMPYVVAGYLLGVSP